MVKNTEIETVDSEAIGGIGTEVETEDSEAILDREKCTRQYVLTVHRNVRFLLSQLRESRFIAETVSRSTKSFEYLKWISLLKG